MQVSIAAILPSTVQLLPLFDSLWELGYGIGYDIDASSGQKGMEIM